jgi:xanthine dehydrogenase YagS FAD-binding subunit
MQAFEYTAPRRASQAVELLAAAGHEGRGSLAVAGGSDLYALMKDGVVAPGRLVDVSRLGELSGVTRRDDGGFDLGAVTTIDALAHDTELAAAYPAVSQAFSRVASPQIRHVGTLGGNLCQRPRCWYFRLGYGLIPRGADGAALLEKGDDRYHAIFGNDGPAKFVSPSTVAPLLIACGAEVSTVGPGGERRFPLAELYRTPAADGESEHTLARGELVARVHLPAPPEGRAAASYEVRQRTSLDWSLATASVVLTLLGGRVASAGVWLGQVAPVPWHAEGAEAALVGNVVDAATAAAAGEAAVAGARPLKSNRYKIQLTRTAVKRAVLAAAGKEV